MILSRLCQYSSTIIIAVGAADDADILDALVIQRGQWRTGEALPSASLCGAKLDLSEAGDVASPVEVEEVLGQHYCDAE